MDEGEMTKPELSNDLIDAWNMRFQNSEGIAYSNFSEICDQARLANALQRELDELRGRMAEPTEAMLIAARDWSVYKYGKGIGNDAAIGCWKAMLAAQTEGKE